MLEIDSGSQEQKYDECDSYEPHLKPFLRECSHDLKAMRTDIIGHRNDALEQQPSLIAHIEQVVTVVRGKLVNLCHFLHHEGDHHREP